MTACACACACACRERWFEQFARLTPRQLQSKATTEGVSSSALDNAGSDEEIMELIFEKMLQKHMDTLKEEL
jgi:hypothetical protein